MANFLGKIPEKFVCLSSQIDIYRNVKGYKFLNSLSSDEEIELYNKVGSEFYQLYYSDRFNLQHIDNREKAIEFFKKGVFQDDNTIFRSSAYVESRDDEYLFLKLNCKEHISITAKLPGVNFFRCGHFAFGLESDLDEKLEYAYNTDLGFVFQDVKLTGNGFKMIGLLHLPAIRNYKLINLISKRLSELGIEIHNYEEKYMLSEDFYVVEFSPNNCDEFSAIRKMDEKITEVIGIEVENRRKLLGIKMDYYKEKFEKYKTIISNPDNLSAYIVSKFISLAMLLRSMELVMDYDIRFLVNMIYELRSLAFYDEETQIKKLIEISDKLVGDVEKE